MKTFFLCGITQNVLKSMFPISANSLLFNDVKIYLGRILTARKKSSKYWRHCDLYYLLGTCQFSGKLKGTQSAMGPRWPGHCFCPVWKAFTSTRNQMYPSDTFRNPLQSCLVFHSILDPLLKISFSVNFYSSITLFYHIWLETVFKGTWIEGEKSPSFTKIAR